MKNKSNVYKIKKSMISGNGAFASKNLKKGTNIGKAFKKVSQSGDNDKDYERTELGKMTNHSSNPNVKLLEKDNNFFFITIKNIKKDEEILIDYSTIPWEGKREF